MKVLATGATGSVAEYVAELGRAPAPASPVGS
jgi:hypothetical protein